MALANANQGAAHTDQRITWTRSDGVAQDLTGATLTGRIYEVAAPDEPGRAIDGTLSLVTAASGIFDWLYGTNDLASHGEFCVQFKATYGDGSYDLSDPADWAVVKAI